MRHRSLRAAPLAVALLLLALPARAQLAGTYTVGGASPDFPTLKDAAATLNAQGISAQVKLSVRPGVYDAAVVFGTVAGTSPSSDIQVLASDPANAPVLRNSAATSVTNYVVRLDGTTDVSFTGIRFEAAGAGSSGRLVEIRGATAARVVIKNCVFVGLPGTTGVAASLVTVATPEMPGLSVTGTTFSQGYAGLDLSEDVFGLTVADNVFAGQDGFGARLRGNGTVSANTVSDGPTSRFTYVGLAVSSALEGFRVLRNTVVVKRGTTGLSAPGAAAVSNNTVSITAPSGLRGIQAGGTLVAHNTVRATLNAAALETTAGGLPTTLHGNLLISAGNGPALAVAGALGASDHNDLVSPGASVVTQGGTGYATLAAWQAASGKDAASVSRTVTFVSIGTSPDLHLSGTSLTDPFLIAGAIPEVPRDADNDLRDTYNAKMGADEGTRLPPLDNADTAAGLYHVAGTSPAFATPQSFFDHLAARGMKGQVTALLRPGTFPLQATLPADLRVGAAAANPSGAQLVVTRQPGSARPVLTASGVGATANWVLRIDGLDRVNLLSLDFQAAAGDYGTLLRLGLGPDGQGVDDLQVTGCTFDGALGGTTGTTRALVSAAPGPHHRGRYTANTFLDGSMGVLYDYASGSAVPADPSFDVTFDANTFTGQVARGVDGTVSRVVFTDNAFTGGQAPGAIAIGLRNSGGYSLLRNQILYTGPGAHGVRLYGTSVPSGTQGVIANNLIRANRPVWIYVGSTGGRIVHNTLVAVGTGSSPVQALFGGNTIGEMAGNLLLHDAAGPALDIDPNSTVGASNGNVFWTTGSVVARYGGADHATLGAYQAATGFDAASRVFLPTFVDATTDLHLAASMDGDAHLAVPAVAGLPTDIDGDVRGSAFAYAGADELSPLAPLAGLYTVGAQAGLPPPSFDTLPDALFAVETLGVSGPTTLALAPTPLVGPFTIRPFPGASATNRLRLTSASEASPTTIHNPGTGEADNAALRIDGAAHVSLTGLTLQGTLGSGPYGRALVLEGAVEDLFVDEVQFRGRLGTGANAAALVFGSAGTTTDLVIQNSLFTNGSVGIQLTADAGPAASGTVLRNLTMTGVASGGVYLVRHVTPLLEDVAVTGASTAAAGILLSQGTGGTVSRARVTLSPSASSRALILAQQSGTAGAPTRVENSFLTAGDNALYATQVEHLRVVHTSMLATGGTGSSATLLRVGGTEHVYRNNVIVHRNGQRVLAETGSASAVVDSDHNVLSTTGPVFSVLAGVEYPTLAAFQSATGRDGGSVNVPVSFVNTSTGDLHLAGASIGDNALAAPPLPDVTRDIDLAVRSTTAVYRGADEHPTPLTASVVFGVSAWLQGAADGARMRTSLAAAGVVPLTQPYADPAFDGTALDYDGTESVPAGFFAANPSFVDWVLVGLRRTPEGPDVARRALLVTDAGSIRSDATGTVYSFPVLPGTYHVVVYHRNHLALMSTAVALSAAPAAVDLTQQSGAGVYGGAAAGVVVPAGRLALAAGDADASGSVLAPDRQSVWLPQVGQTGYRAGDATLDGSVLADDLNGFILPNIGRQSLVPGAGARPDAPSAAETSAAAR